MVSFPLYDQIMPRHAGDGKLFDPPDAPPNFMHLSLPQMGSSALQWQEDPGPEVLSVWSADQESARVYALLNFRQILTGAVNRITPRPLDAT